VVGGVYKTENAGAGPWNNVPNPVTGNYSCAPGTTGFTTFTGQINYGGGNVHNVFVTNCQ
jgi:hypothetical protein